MNSVLTHIDWNLIVAAMILLSIALVFVVDVIAFVVFNAEIKTVMAIDLVILTLIAIFICVQIRTATDNFKNEDLVIAQNFTLSK
jgi:hypothetical protein